MEKLSTSQMRQNGLTAFEAELVNYILANEISEGTTFHGVPGHARYGAQRTAAALRAAHRATIAARVWLRSSHEFYAQDGDPIRCTGWQFVGYNIAAAVVALLLCIEY